jgi:hypothetical protein
MLNCPDRLLLPFRFDPLLMQRDLDALAAVKWTNHFVRQNFEGSWSVIPLRAPKGATHPSRMIYSDPTCKEFVPTPFLDASPYFNQILSYFKCEFRTVRLMKLTPGSIIKEHEDPDLDFNQGQARMHIPVRTNPEVEFYLNGSRVVMEEGSCWYLRLADPHRVANRGQSDRIHLVVDTFVNDWVRTLFESAMAQSSKAIAQV